ncbi:NAD-dependent epimerase/dehydratase family protein [Microbacterium keratanolyticum]
MTDVLILGGTGWLSGRVAAGWVAAGAAVTCLARGARSAPAGTTLVQADRDDPDAYAEVAGREWDEVVDISSQASHVAAAVQALGERAARWTYVSSASVYSDDETIGADESAPRHLPAQPGDEYEYGAQKVAAEDAVARLGDRALIVRPGLVVGTGDPSDRFGYWSAAFARAGAEPVLQPETGGRRAQYWMGARSLPLWLPADMPGFMARSNTRFRQTGGVLSPLEATIGRVRAYEEARGIDRERRAGLTRADERELLQRIDCPQ